MLKRTRSLSAACLAATLAFIAMFAAGCGSAQPTRDGTAPPPAAWPPFPAEPRSASLTSTIRLGSEAELQHPGALISATTLVLEDDTDGFEWGIWRFNTTEAPDHVEVNHQFTEEAWIGLADFTLSRWEFTGPHTTNQQSLAVDPPRHVSPQGDVFVAVISGLGAAARVTSLELFEEEPGGGGWVIQTLDSTDSVSLIEPDTKTSMAIVGGFPAIAYFQRNTGNLRYIRALDSEGADWSAPITVGIPEEAGASPSLAVLTNGQPAIGFTGPVNGSDDAELRYVRALNNFGVAFTDWDAQVEFPTDASAVQLAIMGDGHPAMCYNETVLTNALFFRRADDLVGDLWGDIVSVDGNLGSGDWSALRVVDGNPAIAYYDDNGTLQFPQQGVVKYARADTPDGSSWSFQTLDDTGGDAFVSMTVAGGRPAISYYDFEDGELRYLRADDAQGNLWTADFELLDGAGAPVLGWFSSMTTIGGIPSVAYGNEDNGDLHFVQSNDSSGTAWGTPELVEAGPLALFMSLQEVDGRPAMSYIDQGSEATGGVLKYAIFLP